MLSEFDLIKQYFVRPPRTAPFQSRAQLGIGDDCALLGIAPGRSFAISSDMLVEGRHFFAGEDPRRLGHKSLAVNLSDLAAMGAQPAGFTLALALPAADRDWLAGFSAGLFALADAHGCELIGGDTTKGPLNICITVFGEVVPGQALRRDAAQSGDDIWISGTLGDARLALAGIRGEVVLAPEAQQLAETRLHLPTPRIALGRLLAEQGLARAAIDISDGLVGDLGHILERSGVGATLDVDALPAGPALAALAATASATGAAIPPAASGIALRRAWTAAGGDDYELCFTAEPAQRAAILAAGAACGTPVTRVGRIDAAPGLQLTDGQGAPLDLRLAGFDHFGNGA